LQLLVLQGMQLTLHEILECEQRLQAEIAEREYLLAAVKVLKGYAEKGKSLHGVELGAFGKALLTNHRDALLLDVAPQPAAEALAQPAAPELPPPKPYVHPELENVGHHHGRDTAVVQWAINRMTSDFTLHDVAKLLKQEGAPLKNAQISVVLTRFHSQGRIQVIKLGRGPVPSVFQTAESNAQAVVPAAA
jgi:hypothetical protein